MKSTEELLNEIYSFFLPEEPEEEDQDTQEEEEGEDIDPDSIMSNLMVDCIETGIGYWNTRFPEVKGESEFYSERVWEAVKRGETLTFGDEDDKGDLNLESILKSLNTLMKHSPRVYANIIEENWDAMDCDVFFQTAIFGELVFG